MAVIYLSALINRIKGRLGDVAYVTNHGVNYVKLSPKVFSHPPTYRTAQIKANISEISRAWDSLTDSEKDLWQYRALKHGRHHVGYNEFMALNSTLLHASHADLTMISYPALRPATPRSIRNFSLYPVGAYSICLFWNSPLNSTDYVQVYFRLHRNFCSLNPSFGLCTTVGYRPCWRFVETVRSDVGFITHNFDWPPDTRLYYRARTIDKFGRHSPFNSAQQIFTGL